MIMFKMINVQGAGSADTSALLPFPTPYLPTRRCALAPNTFDATREMNTVKGMDHLYICISTFNTYGAIIIIGDKSVYNIFLNYDPHHRRIRYYRPLAALEAGIAAG